MRNINVRNLFIVACVLKVASALAGWHFNSPWVLGFALPLVVMIGYMFIGAKWRNADVSDEKFADSCYYLGFIFTIASISVALMDLPNIGVHIQDIAVRFGAAMLSTVLGLSVRVAMVTFRNDFGDAVHNAEDGVVEASIRFRDQLGAALDRLSSFESAVDQAARLSVERVNLQVENLSKNHADGLAEFFATLSAANQEALNQALREVKGASTRLSASVDDYAKGMRSNLQSIEAKVVAFSDAVATRLRSTTFPDDYFAKQLAPPLGQLKSAVDVVHGHIIGASETVGDSTAMLAGTLKKLRTKTSTTEATLESVAKLAAQQQLLMDGAQGQLAQLERVNTTFQGLERIFERTVKELESVRNDNAELKNVIRSVIADSKAEHKDASERLNQLAGVMHPASETRYQNFETIQLPARTGTSADAALDANIASANTAAAGGFGAASAAYSHRVERPAFEPAKPLLPELPSATVSRPEEKAFSGRADIQAARGSDPGASHSAESSQPTKDVGILMRQPSR